jgi:hypothetical protein
MLTKILRPAILISLAFAPCAVGHAADMAVDCKLKGGTVVQLPAEACKMEGGTQVNAAVSPAAEVVPAASLSKLEATQKSIIDILGKNVESATPLNRNPEVIERTAKFDGCRLIVDEQLHIEYGNAYSVWRDFKINSVIDLQNINRDEFGILGKVTSKGGDLTGVAVYFEEKKRKDENNISISVLYLRNGAYTKYKVHGPSAYWNTPSDDLWIEDEHGYTKDTGWDTAATEKIRILLIVRSSDDATRLKGALDEVITMCKSQQSETH